MTRAKHEFYDLLPVFWLTPLAYGLKELEKCECDRYLRWMSPILGNFPAINKLCRQPHPGKPLLKVEIPINLFETSDNKKFKVINWYQRLKDETEIDFDLLAPPSPVGCMLYESKNGIFFNCNTLKYLYQYWLIKNYTRNVFADKNFRQLEIGGGYGGFAYQVLTRHPKATYVFVDLPETMILSIYYLRENFPEIPMVLYRHFDGNINWDEYQIHFIPSNHANMIQDSFFDLVVNSNSFLEMRPEDIQQYFRLIQDRNRVKYFFNYNRKKRTEGNTTYTFSQLPYNHQWEHLLDRESIFNVSFNELRNSPIIERLSVRLQ